MHIAIIYFTKGGVTRQLASAIAQGAINHSNITINTYEITGDDIVKGRFRHASLFSELDSADAIIFGSPTYMGSVAAQFKAFADASSEAWCEQRWAGKLAAGFTCGSAVNGEQTSTLGYLMTLASQHGMLWVGFDFGLDNFEGGVNRFGCSLGVVAHAPEGQAHSADLATANYLGKRVSSQLSRINRVTRPILTECEPIPR
ncbi:flavodoxin family protein [Aestuariibacter sp. AA17]|uniref:Flavodoxin family protein n=1 Tax=Fluctibacter corallii TaxID=2984329 RepID=A0ABT3ACD0_9ALTE|nr:flavodoxin family protein [Aestuariibacter sp. AA17]MCV2886331.1 flavodoxin family protein [Aestuariibacter sp. AA17]